MGEVPLNLMAASDVGNIVDAVLKQGPQKDAKTLSLSVTKQTIRELADTATRCLQCAKIKYKQVNRMENKHVVS